MIAPSAPAALSDPLPSTPDVLMARAWGDFIASPQRDLVQSCQYLRQAIGRCLLQIEALGASQNKGCHNARLELGRLNLMLAREDFRSRESALETCRIVRAQLRETFAVLEQCSETVRGAAYLRLSSLVDDWGSLEMALRHFAAKLEDYEGESYSENVVYTPIVCGFSEQRPRFATALANWLSAKFTHAPARLHRTAAKF